MFERFKAGGYSFLRKKGRGVAMSEQKQVRKVNKSDEDKKVENQPVDNEKAKKIKEDMDKLLDEIDEILEANSEEFMESYIQTGGE